MSAHPYIKVRLTSTTPDPSTHLTGNIAIEAYASTQRTYAMVVFRAATVGDEQTNRMLESHGESRKGPCPPPVTGLLCKSEVNIQSVWQWLSLYCGRLVYLVNEPMLHTNIAVLPSGHLRIHSGQSLEQTRLRHDTSRESFDSSLPAYELPPPSIRSSIPEQTEVISPPESPSEDEEEDEDEDDEEFTPPAYWDIARQTEYGRTYASNESDRIARTFTQSMPMLPEPDTQNLYQDIEVALDLGIGSPESNAGARQPN
ncbi:hypothetical protein IWW50_001686 [Coemansia erecta]|nr:hypothetical protein IWW50_001686 [Coemansia erecta]